MDINECFDRIRKASKNISDIVVLNKDNYIIRSTNNDAVRQMSGLVQVVDKCRASFKENDGVTFLKLRTKKCEYLVVPDGDYMMVAIQHSEMQC